MSEVKPARKIAKVAQILDDLEVVLNVGRDDGVKSDWSYLVYRDGPEIFDPDTNESLGMLEIIVGKGSVTQLENRFCVIRSSDFLRPMKRVITKAPQTMGGSALSSFFKSDIKEEVMSPPERAPFKNPQVGDKARRV